MRLMYSLSEPSRETAGSLVFLLGDAFDLRVSSFSQDGQTQVLCWICSNFCRNGVLLGHDIAVRQ
jgi:hypothetical protein